MFLPLTSLVVSSLLSGPSLCLDPAPGLDPFSGPRSAQDSKPEPAKPDVYDEEADAARDIAAALERAKKDHKRVLLQWGANWCGWCKVLHAACGKQPIARKLRYEYEVVLIDIGRWDKHTDLAEKYGADLKAHGVPFLTVLDAEGKVVTNQDSTALEKTQKIGDGHDVEKVMAFLSSNQAPTVSAQALLETRLAAAKKDGRRVFLTFGAPWCGWCHRLEDWMARPEVAKLLARDFVPLKIDIDRYEGGKEIMLRYRGEESGGIPWFCFLDGEGQELADSEGPKGNLGCPWTEAEVAAFGTILQKVCVQLGPEDIAALLKTMGPPKEQGADGESGGP